jgi:hypothetical protein
MVWRAWLYYGFSTLQGEFYIPEFGAGYRVGRFTAIADIETQLAPSATHLHPVSLPSRAQIFE